MLDTYRSCYVWLVHVSSGYVRIGQVRSKYFKFANVRACHNMLGYVRQG
jgi:hypothetical protein